jgi:glycosyltransferase involved in cell wall biosynthesis
VNREILRHGEVSISVCLPNLNTARYLPERFDCILAQTFTDWECIVVDNYSDDGSWKIIQSYAARDPRIKATQAPRDPLGMYPNWNNCLRQARGEFVYIATSDDTMAPDCLQMLRDAILKHPECGMAHCDLLVIDANSKPVDGIYESWEAVDYFGPLMGKEHVRPRGHDSVVACAFFTPYRSITQLLFRRDLLEKTGLFDGKWESYGDMAWQMRAALYTNTVHVPGKLGTWRMHPSQASQQDKACNDRRNGMFVAMVDEFLAYARREEASSGIRLPARLRRYMVVKMWMVMPWKELTRWEKVKYLAKRLVLEPRAALLFLRTVRWIKQGRNPQAVYEEVRRDIHRLGLGRPLAADEAVAAASSMARDRAGRDQ